MTNTSTMLAHKPNLAMLPIIFAASLTLLACGSHNSSSMSAVTWLNNTPIGLDDQWKLTNNPERDSVWLAYYQDTSSLYLRSPQGSVQMLVDGASGAAPSGIALALTDDSPATLWRDKIPSKGLFLKQGDAPPLEIGVEGFDTEPLVRFDIHPDNNTTQQGLHALWYGERINPQSQSKYNLYYRHIDAQGHPSATELVLPGFYPQWIISADNDVAVFSWDGSQSPPQILMRQRGAQSGQFDAVRVIATSTDSVTPIFRAFRFEKRWFVMWVEQHGQNKSEFLIRGLWSDDKGANWTNFDFPTIKGFDISELKVAHDAASGHAMMAISGSWRLKDPKAMNTFYVVSSTDNGAHWSEPKIIRDTQANNTSRADAAQVFFGDKPGSAWVVWEDWRDIRGRLYFAYSEDFGKTWLYNNKPLAGQPDGNNIIAFNTEGGYRNALGQHFVAANITSDAGIQKKLFSIALNDTALQQSLELSKKQKVSDAKALSSRVTGYWKAMANSKYDVGYGYLDPFMRAVWPLDLYQKRLGRIKYKDSVVIDGMNINGNFADVSLRIKAYVPEFEQGGKKQSMPEREVPITERWLWVDGNWFREYSEESSEIKFTRYQ